MSTVLRKWADAAWETLTSLPGVEDPGEVKSAWENHNKTDHPVVTVFGVYDAGKSSLIKRLRVDDGGDVPEWLTVSSRPETFTVQETDAFGCTLRDTPGISVRDDHHEYLALNALAATDVILTVLPPQLFTSERESVLEVLRGGLYGVPSSAAYGANSISVVLSRSDLLGADPVSRPKAFSQVIARKRREFQAVLEKSGIDARAIEFRAVAADPSGMVGDETKVKASDYDEGRQWDGIKDLSDWLASLPSALPELRLYSELRHLGFVLGGLRTSLDGEVRVLKASVRTSEAENESQKHTQERFEGYLNNAKAELEKLAESDFTAENIRAWDTANTGKLRELVVQEDSKRRERTSSYSWRRVCDSALSIFESHDESDNKPSKPGALATAEVIESLFDKVRKSGNQADAKATEHDIDTYTDVVFDVEKSTDTLSTDDLPTGDDKVEKLWNQWTTSATVAALVDHVKVMQGAASRLQENLVSRQKASEAVVEKLDSVLNGSIATSGSDAKEKPAAEKPSDTPIANGNSVVEAQQTVVIQPQEAKAEAADAQSGNKSPYSKPY